MRKIQLTNKKLKKYHSFLAKILNFRSYASAITHKMLNKALYGISPKFNK